MGVTGTGKSSFIKLLTGFGVEIGHNLESCWSRFHVDSLQLQLMSQQARMISEYIRSSMTETALSS